MDEPASLALLQLCKKAYALVPSAWLATPPEAVAEHYPFITAEQAFDQLQKPLEAIQLRRLVWQYGDAAIRQRLLERMSVCDSFQDIVEQINSLPDAAEADRCFHRFIAMLKNARRYEEALTLVAMVSKRGNGVDAAQRQDWLNEVKEIAMAMSSQSTPMTPRMEETVVLIGNLLPPDSGLAPTKPTTPD
jgi:hypothetical protein